MLVHLVFVQVYGFGRRLTLCPSVSKLAWFCPMTGESGSQLSYRMCITIMNDVKDTSRYSMSFYLGSA